MKRRDELVPAAEARATILRGAAPSEIEPLSLSDAAWRVLAEDLEARRTQPPFAASAMDGYAVRSDDLSTIPARLKVVGTAAAGRPHGGTIGPGEAARIFTGAPVPDGADTVVIQENTHVADGCVEVRASARHGQFVRPAGLDFAAGDILLRRGDVLDPQRLALAASMNHPTVPVWRRPRIALAATGDELVPAGREPGPGQIIASNTFALAAMIDSAGGTLIDLGIVPDREDRLRDSFAKAFSAGADVLVTTGGASVGDHDLVLPVLEQMGARFHFTRIAMRPGKPMLAGEIEHRGRSVRLIGLAGNPVSSIVAATIFLRPLISRLAGLPDRSIAPVEGVLGRDLAANDEREEYMRAKIDYAQDGRPVATPFERQDSSMLAYLVRADGLVIRPANAPAAQKGDPCEIVLLRPAQPAS